MKKILTIIGIFGLTLIQAQQVGINTDDPKATLDVNKNPNLDKNTPQGVLFPKFNTAERSDFTDVEKGMMIYNTDKECVEIYSGIKSGVAQWNCMPGTASASAQNIAITPAGFEGPYVAGVAMTPTNKVKFELKNNSFSGISNVDFSGAVSITNGNSDIATNTSENNDISLAAGASTTLSYSLTGTPVEGKLTANFNKLSLQTEQSTTVGWGGADIKDKTVYVVSLTHNGKNIQGKINNGDEKLTIEIPYTGGQGSYDAYTTTLQANPGEGGSTANLTLNIPAGNFGINGSLTATITVDNEYLVTLQTPGADYDIAEFNDITLGKSKFNLVLKGIGGIADRYFGDGTNHDFVYLPVEVTGTHNVNGQPYKKTWLNMNLGAEYANTNSPDFNLFVNKTGNDAHSDDKTYGSLFQWQRKADGHEFRNSTRTGDLASSWTASGSWDGKFITTYNRNWVSNGGSATGNDLELWQTNGANNPCPVNYHIPTQAEWGDLHEAVTGYRVEVHNSNFLNQTILPNLATAGYHLYGDGSPTTVGTIGNYWSSEFNLSSGYSWSMYFLSGRSFLGYSYYRSHGFSARCIKDEN